MELEALLEPEVAVVAGAVTLLASPRVAPKLRRLLVLGAVQVMSRADRLGGLAASLRQSISPRREEGLADIFDPSVRATARHSRRERVNVSE